MVRTEEFYFPRFNSLLGRPSSSPIISKARTLPPIIGFSKSQTQVSRRTEQISRTFTSTVTMKAWLNMPMLCLLALLIGSAAAVQTCTGKCNKWKVVKIRVYRYSEEQDTPARGITMVYADGSEWHTGAPKNRRDDWEEPPFVLEDDETIVHVYLEYDSYLIAVQFTTNKGRKSQWYGTPHPTDPVGSAWWNIKRKNIRTYSVSTTNDDPFVRASARSQDDKFALIYNIFEEYGTKLSQVEGGRECLVREVHNEDLEQGQFRICPTYRHYDQTNQHCLHANGQDDLVTLVNSPRPYDDDDTWIGALWEFQRTWDGLYYIRSVKYPDRWLHIGGHYRDFRLFHVQEHDGSKWNIAELGSDDRQPYGGTKFSLSSGTRHAGAYVHVTWGIHWYYVFMYGDLDEGSQWSFERADAC